VRRHGKEQRHTAGHGTAGVEAAVLDDVDGLAVRRRSQNNATVRPEYRESKQDLGAAQHL
jgi:hypothetical protein